MEKEEPKKNEKLLDKDLYGSLHSKNTDKNEKNIINNIERERGNSSIVESNKTNIINKVKPKVMMINYFDPDIGNYKKILVKRVNNH